MRPKTSPGRGSTIVVHGHTPHLDVEIAEHSINLDTACVYGGRLTAMEVHSREVWSVESAANDIAVQLRDGKDSRRQARRFNGCVAVRVEWDGKTLEFETVNYSELGVLMRPMRAVRIPPGSLVSGVIGPGLGEKPFRGVVLRVDGDGRHAVKLE